MAASFSMRMIGFGAILALLAGCGAHVSDATTAKASAAPPSEILVEVSASPDLEDDQAKDIQSLLPKLQSDLVQQLKDAKLTAEAFTPGTSRPGTAVLRVAITEADAGSYWKRFAVGLSFGRPRLQAKVDLESADAAGAQPMTAFDTSSASGRFMPGMILPIGIAAAARNVIPLAVGGGLKTATSFRGGLDDSAKGTAKGITAQLKKYYGASGWA